MINILLLAFAFVCFILSALGVGNPPRLNLLPLGLAFWVLSVLLGVARL